MANQIEQLRTKFNGMSTAQKKIFINNLKKQLEGKNSPAYSQFLSECVKKYNTEMSKPKSVSIDVDDLFDGIEDKGGVRSSIKIPTKTNLNIKRIAVFGAIVAVAITIIVVAFNLFSGSDNKDRLLGEWVRGDTRYTFNANGSFSYRHTGGAIAHHRTNNVSYSGTYTVSGNNLIVRIDADTVNSTGIFASDRDKYLDGSWDTRTNYRLRFNGNDRMTLTNENGDVQQYSRR